MYAHIHKQMCEYGCIFTSMQIENKMKAFEKAYKNKLLNKGPTKSGRGRMCLEFEQYVRIYTHIYINIYCNVFFINSVCNIIILGIIISNNYFTANWLIFLEKSIP